jgi:hypothetical protein
VSIISLFDQDNIIRMNFQSSCFSDIYCVPITIQRLYFHRFVISVFLRVWVSYWILQNHSSRTLTVLDTVFWLPVQNTYCIGYSFLITCTEHLLYWIQFSDYLYRTLTVLDTVFWLPIFRVEYTNCTQKFYMTARLEFKGLLWEWFMF